MGSSLEFGLQIVHSRLSVLISLLLQSDRRRCGFGFHFKIVCPLAGFLLIHNFSKNLLFLESFPLVMRSLFVLLLLKFSCIATPSPLEQNSDDPGGLCYRSFDTATIESRKEQPEPNPSNPDENGPDSYGSDTWGDTIATMQTGEGSEAEIDIFLSDSNRGILETTSKPENPSDEISADDVVAKIPIKGFRRLLRKIRNQNPKCAVKKGESPLIPLCCTGGRYGGSVIDCNPYSYFDWNCMLFKYQWCCKLYIYDTKEGVTCKHGF